MLRISLLCVGKTKEKYFSDAFSEYKKRLGANCELNLIEIDEERLPESPSASEIDAALLKEAREISKRLPKSGKTVAMCIEGNAMSSEELAEYIESLSVSGCSRLCFVIGGSFGLHENIKSGADLKLSMSKMTFPHSLARVILAEQIYRAMSISVGTKYHK